MKKIYLFILLLIGIITSSLTIKVMALSPNYNGFNNEIYYFSDSKPILSNNDFNNYFGNSNYTICYDIPYYVDDNTLLNMYNNQCFQGFSQDTIVIFEIKTRLIDGYVLNNIFGNMQQQGCYIIFVSGFSDSSYNTDILQYIDDFIQCNPHIPFEDYVYMSVIDILTKHGSSEDPIIIIVDSRYVDINDWTNSKYLQLVLDILCVQLNLSSSVGNYEDIYSELVLNNLVYFIVNTTFNNYTFIGGSECNIINNNALKTFIANYVGQNYECYAMGIINLRTDFYNLLYDWYSHDGEIFPIYVWVIDEVLNSQNGLPVITDTYLAILNGYEIINYDPASDEIILALNSAIYGD